MKRASLYLFAVLMLAIVALAACGPSPRERAKDFAKLMPDEIDGWTQIERGRVELTANTVSNTGHTTLQFNWPTERDPEVIAYVVIEAHPSEDAADVAYAARVRDFQLMGLTTESSPQPQTDETHGTNGAAVYALLKADDVVVEIDAFPQDEGVVVDEDAFDELLSTVRQVYRKAVD